MNNNNIGDNNIGVRDAVKEGEEKEEGINKCLRCLNPLNLLKRKYIAYYILVFGSLILGGILLALGLTIWKDLTWQGWVSVGSLALTFLLLISNFQKLISFLSPCYPRAIRCIKIYFNANLFKSASH